ncbi:MAG: hypothetical protein N2316_07815 [Spirochaetes bacterium]|nr:hypothetical protein [Spirochaetota bacterium]
MADESTQQSAKKTKKINKMNIAELTQKINELQSAGHTKSIYFKHLLRRKKELESRAS